MNTGLTQKERMLLEDQKSHEEICIQKYTNYAGQAQDPQLAQLFGTYAEQEQQHLDTINQMLSGEAPSLQQQGQGGGQSPGQSHSQSVNQSGRSGQQPVSGTMTMENAGDAALCTDMLMTEKHVSSTYDTAIFEFTDANARQALNHIQREEQQHGEGIFNYMQGQGMYKPQ